MMLSRRRFFGAAGMATAGMITTPSRILEVEQKSVTELGKVKITDVRTAVLNLNKYNTTLIKVMTDSGFYGLGEAYPKVDVTPLVADVKDHIVGFQSLDKWAKYSDSFDHVGVLGTFVLPAWRKKRIGSQLTEYSFYFARKHNYEKLVIYVRASNFGAITFYRNLGFTQKGILARQVKIDNHYDDEIFMEFFL